MSTTTLLRFAALAIAIAPLAGCAGSDAPNASGVDDAGGGGGGGSDSGSSGYDAGSTEQDSGSTQQDSGSGQTCVQTCATDTDCQNSCPGVDGGVNCCDTASKTCFASATATCPAQQGDSGTPPGY